MTHRCTTIAICLAAAVFGCSDARVEPPGDHVPGPEIAERPWRSLFDGESLGNWAITSYGGQGDVHIEDGAIVMPMGSAATGITWRGEPPARMGYEIEWQAMRTLGNDFFCGLTYPVGDDYCSLIASGWGGAVVGLSSLDGADASANETTQYMRFENDRWYHFRLQVDPGRIRAWIDEERVIDVDITGKSISIRPEVNKARPLGFTTWVTEGRVKSIRWRRSPDGGLVN